MANLPNITFIPFAPQEQAESLQRLLTDLGYAIKVPRLQDLVEACRTQYGNILIMLFGQSELPRENIMPLLSQKNRSPALGVFQKFERIGDDEILTYCEDFSCWPCEGRELSARLQRLALCTKSTNALSESELAAEFVQFNLVGMSPKFVALLQLIKKIARCDAPVLIEGETGTGKELAARAIHYLSARRDFPFIPINCGALPDNLVESELFGHARGAFTDAKTTHLGLVARAKRGTLFLDEVDSLSHKAQVTLLRFLQDRTYLPVGGEDYQEADIRVLTATNRPLADLVASGEFRQDLYYRLNIVAVQIPPLRQRDGDVPLLANHFMNRYQDRYGLPQKVLDDKTLKWMACYDWPGNVRELESVIHRAFLLDDSGFLAVDENYQQTQERRRNHRDRRCNEFFETNFQVAKAAAVSDFEQRYLRWIISQTQGNVSKAAVQIGKERRTLGKLLKKYGIDPCIYRK